MKFISPTWATNTENIQYQYNIIRIKIGSFIFKISCSQLWWRPLWTDARKDKLSAWKHASANLLNNVPRQKLTFLPANLCTICTSLKSTDDLFAADRWIYRHPLLNSELRKKLKAYTSRLEQLTCWTSVTWHLAGRFQSQTEDISV